MPRNRQEVPREERIDALLTVAEQQFLARGFARTSIAEIARAAGIEPGSVYWYFRSKDHAFAAVLNRLLDSEMDRITDLTDEPPQKLFAALDSVERRRTLHPCVAERAPHAPPIMKYHERLHEWLHGLALRAVADLVPEPDHDIAADAVVATIEGGLANPAPSRPTSHLVRYLLASFTDAGAFIEADAETDTEAGAFVRTGAFARVESADVARPVTTAPTHPVPPA